MIKFLKKNKEIIIFSTGFFMLSFLAVFTKDVDLMNYYSFLSFLPFAFLSFIYLIYNKEVILSNSSLLLWLIFLFLLFLSELQNGMVLDSIILFSITGILLMSKIKIDKILLSSIIGVFPVFLAASAGALLGNKFTSNSVGIVVSFFLVSVQLYYSLIIKVREHKRLSNFLFFAINVITFWVLFKINSRTSLLICSVSLVILIFHVFYSSRRNIFSNINKSTGLIRSVYIVSIFLMIVIFLLIVYKAVNNIFTPKWRPDDISTGRFDIWLTTIENRELFGHRYDWYTASGLFGEHKGPHNMFIGVLGFGGIVPLSLLILVLTSTMNRLLRCYFKNSNILNLVLLSMVVLSNVKGLTESLLLQTSYQLYNIYFILPIVYVGNKKSIGQIHEVNCGVTKLYFFSISVFFILMILNIYGSVFNFNIENILGLISRYI